MNTQLHHTVALARLVDMRVAAERDPGASPARPAAAAARRVRRRRRLRRIALRLRPAA